MTQTHPVEKDVKSAIKKLLIQYGWFHFMPAANAFGINGVADILALKDGKFLAIEVKLKKFTASALQEKFLADVNAHGGCGVVINQDRIDTGYFEAMLQSFDS